MLLRVGHHFKTVYPIEAYLVDKVPTVANKVVCRHPVAPTAFHVAVVRLPSCRHVSSGMVVTTITLLKPLYLPTADAPEASIRHYISQANVCTKHLVEFLCQVNWLSAS